MRSPPFTDHERRCELVAHVRKRVPLGELARLVAVVLADRCALGPALDDVIGCNADASCELFAAR